MAFSQCFHFIFRIGCWLFLIFLIILVITIRLIGYLGCQQNMLLGVKFTVFLNKIEGVKISILFFCTYSYNQSHFIKVETLAIFINQGRLWAEIEAHKWRNLELNLSITATKFWSEGTSWSVKTGYFALFITD